MSIKSIILQNCLGVIMIVVAIILILAILKCCKCIKARNKAALRHKHRQQQNEQRHRARADSSTDVTDEDADRPVTTISPPALDMTVISIPRHFTFQPPPPYMSSPPEYASRRPSLACLPNTEGQEVPKTLNNTTRDPSSHAHLPHLSTSGEHADNNGSPNSGSSPIDLSGSPMDFPAIHGQSGSNRISLSQGLAIHGIILNLDLHGGNFRSSDIDTDFRQDPEFIHSGPPSYQEFETGDETDRERREGGAERERRREGGTERERREGAERERRREGGAERERIRDGETYEENVVDSNRLDAHLDAVGRTLTPPPSYSSIFINEVDIARGADTGLTPSEESLGRIENLSGTNEDHRGTSVDERQNNVEQTRDNVE